jgi:hypothetical protein
MKRFNFCSECGTRIYPGQSYAATWGHRLCSSCATDLLPTNYPRTMHTLVKLGAASRATRGPAKPCGERSGPSAGTMAESVGAKATR